LPYLVVREATHIHVFLSILYSFTFRVAFYSLLLVWESVFRMTRINRSLLSEMTHFRWILLICLGINILRALDEVLVWTLPATRFWTREHEEMSIAQQLSDVLVAVAFLYYGGETLIRRYLRGQISEYNRRTLDKLMNLSLVGFLTFVVNALRKAVISDLSVGNDVTFVTTLFICYDITITMGGVALILIVNVPVEKVRKPSVNPNLETMEEIMEKLSIGSRRASQ